MVAQIKEHEKPLLKKHKHKFYLHIHSNLCMALIAPQNPSLIHSMVGGVITGHIVIVHSACSLKEMKL
jgi:hypothetical protein